MRNSFKEIILSKYTIAIILFLLLPFSTVHAQAVIFQSEQTITFVGIAVLELLFFLFIVRTLIQQNVIKGLSLPVKLVLFGVFFLLVLVLLLHFFSLNDPLVNNLLFIGLPYAAFTIFLIGSIARYRNTGFKVSSLSSQFLEGKKLFLGTQLFHWSILFLFFGHLTAFLFPRTVLLWNSVPVRLFILEITAFAFAITLLIGICLLIYRRLSQSRLMVVSNNMDMLVYLVLLVQIVTGLLVAYYHRWGSTWFASGLSPYLKSIFVLKPDITVVSSLPWLVKLHIVSAFFIIAIIPFTRFVHFLVAPLDYLWRRYQQVYWNWDRKLIRNSTKHNNGRPYQNH